MHRAYNFNKKGTQLSQLFSCEFYEIFNKLFYRKPLDGSADHVPKDEKNQIVDSRTSLTLDAAIVL